MPEKEIVNNTHYFDPNLWVVIGLSMMGFTYRTLISDEKFKWRKFWGEFVGSLLVAIGLWALGLMQGLTVPQMIIMGVFGGLGSVRSFQHGFKMFRDLKFKGG